MNRAAIVGTLARHASLGLLALVGGVIGCSLAGTPGKHTRDAVRQGDLSLFEYRTPGSSTDSSHNDLTGDASFDNPPLAGIPTVESLCGSAVTLAASLDVSGTISIGSIKPGEKSATGISSEAWEKLQKDNNVGPIAVEHNAILCIPDPDKPEIQGAIREGDDSDGGAFRWYKLTKATLTRQASGNYHLEILNNNTVRMEELYAGVRNIKNVENTIGPGPTYKKTLELEADLAFEVNKRDQVKGDLRLALPKSVTLTQFLEALFKKKSIEGQVDVDSLTYNPSENMAPQKPDEVARAADTAPTNPEPAPDSAQATPPTEPPKKDPPPVAASPDQKTPDVARREPATNQVPKGRTPKKGKKKVPAQTNPTVPTQPASLPSRAHSDAKRWEWSRTPENVWGGDVSPMTWEKFESKCGSRVIGRFPVTAFLKVLETGANSQREAVIRQRVSSVTAASGLALLKSDRDYRVYVSVCFDAKDSTRVQAAMCFGGGDKLKKCYDDRQTEALWFPSSLVRLEEQMGGWGRRLAVKVVTQNLSNPDATVADLVRKMSRGQIVCPSTTQRQIVVSGYLALEESGELWNAGFSGTLGLSFPGQENELGVFDFAASHKESFVKKDKLEEGWMKASDFEFLADSQP